MNISIDISLGAFFFSFILYTLKSDVTFVPTWYFSFIYSIIWLKRYENSTWIYTCLQFKWDYEHNISISIVTFTFSNKQITHHYNVDLSLFNFHKEIFLREIHPVNKRLRSTQFPNKLQTQRIKRNLRHQNILISTLSHIHYTFMYNIQSINKVKYCLRNWQYELRFIVASLSRKSLVVCPFMFQNTVSRTFFTDCYTRNFLFTRESLSVSTPWTDFSTKACMLQSHI